MAEEQIMMSVEKPEALAQAEIHAMRQVADAIALSSKHTLEHMAASTRAMEKLSDKVDGMNTRLVRLEEAKHGKEIERLTAAIEKMDRRLDNLESTRDQQKGAKALVDWLRQTAPWLIAIVAAVLATAGIKPGN